jgi:hypothetical protein
VLSTRIASRETRVWNVTLKAGVYHFGSDSASSRKTLTVLAPR